MKTRNLKKLERKIKNTRRKLKELEKEFLRELAWVGIVVNGNLQTRPETKKN